METTSTFLHMENGLLSLLQIQLSQMTLGAHGRGSHLLL